MTASSCQTCPCASRAGGGWGAVPAAVLAGFLMFLQADNASALAGRVVFAVGDVQVLSSGGARLQARPGVAFDSGDTFLTGRGRAQLRFTDGGRILLMPQTEYRVDSYHFSEQADGSEEGFFSLIKGGIRAITGLIGKLDRATFKVETPVATIGIRGTTFSARLCAADCDVADGLYVKGGEGVVSVRNEFGTVDLGPGEAAFVQSSDSPPEPTSQDPEVVAASESEVVAEDDVVGGEAGTGDSTTSDESFDYSTTAFRDNLGVLGGGRAEFDFSQLVAVLSGADVAETIVPDGGGVAFSWSALSTFLGTSSGGVGAAAGSLSGFPALSIGLNAAGGVVALGVSADAAAVADIDELSSSAGGSLSGIVAFSNVKDAGGSGALYWGRWTDGIVSALVLDSTGPFSSESVALGAGNNIHYVFGQNTPTLPGAGLATYTFAGGTASTSGTSVGGGAIGGQLQIDFGSRSVAVNNLLVRHGSDFNINGGGSLSSSGALQAIGSANGSIPVDMDGFLSGIGSTPPDAGLGYEIHRPGAPINGVAGFHCSVGC